MNWTKKIPEEPGYYFLRDYGEELIVEVIMTVNGSEYLEYGIINRVDCYDLSDARWLGPIKSEDIINLWKSFNEEKKRS